MKKLSTFVFLFILNIFFSNMLFAKSNVTFCFESFSDPIQSIDIRKIDHVQIYYLESDTYRHAAEIMHNMIYKDPGILPIKPLKSMSAHSQSRKNNISNFIILSKPDYNNPIEMEGKINYPSTQIKVGIFPNLIKSFLKYIKKDKYLIKLGTYEVIYVKKKKFR